MIFKCFAKAMVAVLDEEFFCGTVWREVNFCYSEQPNFISAVQFLEKVVCEAPLMDDDLTEEQIEWFCATNFVPESVEIFGENDVKILEGIVTANGLEWNALKCSDLTELNYSNDQSVDGVSLKTLRSESHKKEPLPTFI